MPIRITVPENSNAHEREAAAAISERLADRTIVDDVEIFLGRAALAAGDRSISSTALAAQDSYCIRQSAGSDGVQVLLAGNGRGVLYGTYAWLERQGWSFHLYGDVSPEADTPFDMSEITIDRSPRFKWRGLQLWNFWWPGRDSWGLTDFVHYLDQFPKLGLNQFEFPLYWYEPLFTGVEFAGAPLRRLPLSGVDVNLVRVGADSFDGMGRFTSPAVPDGASDEDRMQAARGLMRKVFAHARSLGLRTTVCAEIGNVFLVDPDLLSRLPARDLYEHGLLVQPSSATGKALARARLKALFDAFPDVDVYALWLTEIGPESTTLGSPHPDDVAFRERHSHLAARLTPGDLDQLQWLRNSAEIAGEINPGATLSIGGWGIERLFEAADETLPDDMIRASIADYEPAFGLRRGAFEAYGKTRGARSHTTWAEVDQHLWIQQPKVTATARVLGALEEHGVESVSQLHWRKLFCDADIFCFAHDCWTNSGGPAELRRHWANLKFGISAGSLAAEGLRHLEAFNDRIVEMTPDILHSLWWVGWDCFVGGLLAADRYLDGEPLSEKFLEDTVHPLLESAQDADRHLSAAAATFQDALQRDASPVQRERLGYWANRAAYSRDLYRAHVALAKAVLWASKAKNENDLVKALAQIKEARAEEVVANFAERLGEGATPDCGELGLLLSLNIKFLGSAKRIEGAIRRLLARQETIPRGVMDVRAGLELPRNLYRNGFELSHLATRPWLAKHDHVHAESGFSYKVIRGKCGRLSPKDGAWSDPHEVVVDIEGPPGWSGALCLYFVQELNWQSPFRQQDCFVNDVCIGQVRDFYCKGEFWDEGSWLPTDVTFPQDGRIQVRIKRRSAGDARLCRFVLETSVP